MPTVNSQNLPQKKLRVLHVYKTWTPETFGGVEQFMTTLSIETKKHGIDNLVLYLGKTKKPILKSHHGIKGICFPLDIELASTGFSTSLIFGFRKFAKWADIIHFHFPWPFGDLVHLLSGTNKPYIVSYHSDIIKQRYLKIAYHPLMSMFLGGAKAIIPASPNYLASSLVLQKYKEKAVVIPYGIFDTASHKPDEERIKYWASLVGNDFAFFMGVLRYYKGLTTLLEAARNVTGKIVIAGDGPMEKELKEYANQHNLKNIVFLGRISDSDKDILFRLSRFFVFPSHLRSEAFGISMLEAAMHAKPLISCEIGTGTTFINIDKKTGIAIPPNSPLDLANAMNRLFESNDLCRLYGEQSRQRFEELFTSSKMAKSYLELYQSVLES